MKTIHLFPVLLASALFAGCVKEAFTEPEPLDPNRIPINVHSAIDQVQTKATAEGFVGGDAIGLYAVNYTDDNATPGTLVAEGNQADNIKYVYDEANHKWAPTKNAYYKDVNTNVDLYLYYPYQADIADINNANFEVKKDQSAAETSTALSGYEASDFLWGKASGVIPVQSAVSVSLSHKLSAVQVTLAPKEFADGEFESLEKSVILTNTTRKATIDYATGVATKLGEPQLDGIVMCPQDDGTFRAVVIPQSVAAGTKLFSITIGGVTYGFKNSQAETEYLTGKQLNVTINVTKKNPTGELELSLGSSQITDWTEDKNAHGGEARQYYVVTVSEPGTLGKTIKAAGKNPDKIKNLKVVGNVKDDDFYFMRDSMAILEAVNMKEAVIKASGSQIEYLQYKINTEEICTRWLCNYGDPQIISDFEWIWYDTEDGRIPSRAFKDKKSLCFFVFPETVTKIGCYAFENTTVSGALIIPDDVTTIEKNAFASTSITSVQFNNKTSTIGEQAFYECLSLSGRLILPESLRSIGYQTFNDCEFTGDLILPDNLESIGFCAFYNTGAFSSGLTLPNKIKKIGASAFSYTSFKGSLDLNNCTELSSMCFCDAGFSGDLIIPAGTIEIPGGCFYNCKFSKIIFPESLRTIGSQAFRLNQCLEEIEFKEGLISIGQEAFNYCPTLLSLNLPSTVQTIQSRAFAECYYLSNITCNATEPPTIQSNTFDGVAKDNFALEVPEASIIRYQTEVGWSDFKRITAHYDFSVGRTRMRALNEGMTRTYVLRCPAGNDWSVVDKPSWVSVTPDHGTGKTDVTIAIDEMARTSDKFEVNVGSFQYPEYKNYSGRKDTVIFKLSERDYTCQLEIEQYDYDKHDGEVIVNQTHSAGSGIDVVFIGEGYDAKDIADGKFLTDCENGYKHFFNIEPYKTYRDYFNVYSVVSQSDESGIETVNTILDNKFMKNGVRDVNAAFKWAKKANSNIDLSKTVVILLDNSSNYYGWTWMYGDGSAMSVVPISSEAYPYDYRGLIQHEAGGHAFGKLGDEYIYHNAYITSCGCTCCDHPSYELDPYSSYGMYKSLGWFKNLSMYSDHNQVPWAHLLYHPTYSNRVDMYEGAYMHMRGMYRSEITSCMNNNIPYFNSISRQAIVERIMDYSGGTFDFNTFVSKDNFTVGDTKSFVDFDWTFGVDPKWNRGTEKGSIIYMGDHPDVD